GRIAAISPAPLPLCPSVANALHNSKKVLPFLSMLARLYRQGIVLLSFLLCACFAFGAQPSTTAAQTVSLPQLPAVASLSVDLDGDGLIDPILHERYGFEESASFALSRSGAISAVRFVPATSEYTLLSAQDVDGDGDVDLLWSHPLHFALSLVCFN